MVTRHLEDSKMGGTVVVIVISLLILLVIAVLLIRYFYNRSNGEEESNLFYNQHEYDAEYILIPDGRYKYQGKIEKEVSDIYFAKYPVTNKQYRHFIRYLQGKEQELLEILPKDEFDKRMIEFASGIKFFGNYLGDRPGIWPVKLRSGNDTDQRLNGEDQPVVNISWFAARAYCYWLSLLEAAGENLSYDNAADLFRLPSEIEWEWAASGGKREYPWTCEKGPPTDKLANFRHNVDVTTSVRHYPDGATPEGLMDMAGNIWEWMENWYDEKKNTRSLRGGSWLDHELELRCSERYQHDPGHRSFAIGFRVVRTHP